MKLPLIQRISREDIPEAPDWVSKLLGPLNQFMETIYAGLNKNITISDNISSQIKEISFTTLGTYVASNDWTEIKFPRTLPTKANGCLILDIKKDVESFDPIISATSVEWIEQNGVIIIKFIAGLADSTKYNCKLLIL